MRARPWLALVIAPLLLAWLPRGGGSGADPVAALLSTMSSGQFKRIDGGKSYLGAMPALTMVNFNGASNDPFTSDALVASNVLGSNQQAVLAFSQPIVNGTNLKVCGFGGGHAASARNPIVCFDAKAAIASVVANQTPAGWYEGRKTGALLACTDAQPSWSFQIGCNPVPGSAFAGWQAPSNSDGSRGICSAHAYTTGAAITGTDYIVFGGLYCFPAGPGNSPGAAEIFNAATNTSTLFHSSQISGGLNATTWGFSGIDSGDAAGGSVCYDHFDGRIYTLTKQSNSFLQVWSSGFLPPTGSSTLSTVSSSTAQWTLVGNDCIIYKDPATPSKRDVVQISCPNVSTPNPASCTSHLLVVTDIESGGSPSGPNSGTIASFPAAYPASGYRPDLMAWCSNDTVIYNWVGDKHIYKLTPQASLSGWSFVDLEGAYSGDTPVIPPGNMGTACAKLDNYNALLLVEEDDAGQTEAVYLFKI